MIYKINHKSRLLIIATGFGLAYIIILFNLYKIQIVQKNKFVNLAQKQYQIKITKTPDRGKILDRYGKIITSNKDEVSAFIMPHKIKEHDKLNKFLNKNFPDITSKIDAYKTKFFMYIKRKLSKKEVKLIERNEIEDIHFINEPSRHYTHKSFCSITGITDIDNKGLFGIEAIYNTILTGKPTTFIVEKDARSKNFYFKAEMNQMGTKAEDIKLTIDKSLQFLTYQAVKDQVKKFKAKEGAAIILDPTNGHILAMVNYPTFNPYDTNNLDLEKTKNKCVTESYELGSVMKVFVAIAALEENAVTLDEEIDCENTKETQINGMKFTTVHPEGIIPFSKVMESSNNIGMVKVATRIGPKIVDYYKKMGFGKKTELKFPAEQSGYVSPPEKWSKRSIISLSFGYEITATLLQLARAFGIIANDGKWVQPKLIFDNIKNESNQIISQNTVSQIKDVLKSTVSKGTAKKAIISGYEVMGKTGTANMVVDGKYSFDHNLYTFGGIVEKDNYKRVIVTFVKDAAYTYHIYASQVTAPLFNTIAEKMLIHEKIVN